MINSTDGETSIRHNGTVRQDPWENKNVLFVHSAMDDEGIPRGAFRVLYHLRRRLGKSGHATQPGIRSIAETCRMKRETVMEGIEWLETRQIIEVERTDRKTNKYELKIDPKFFYIDHRLDDADLSPSEFRVLAHISRLGNEIGEFFVNTYKFEGVCGMQRQTIRAALKSLGDDKKEYFGAYSYEKNPMYVLRLIDKFPEPTTFRVVK